MLAARSLARLRSLASLARSSRMRGLLFALACVRVFRSSPGFVAGGLSLLALALSFPPTVKTNEDRIPTSEHVTTGSLVKNTVNNTVKTRLQCFLHICLLVRKIHAAPAARRHRTAGRLWRSRRHIWRSRDHLAPHRHIAPQRRTSRTAGDLAPQQRPRGSGRTSRAAWRQARAHGDIAPSRETSRPQETSRPAGRHRASRETSRAQDRRADYLGELLILIMGSSLICGFIFFCLQRAVLGEESCGAMKKVSAVEGGQVTLLADNIGIRKSTWRRENDTTYIAKTSPGKLGLVEDGPYTGRLKVTADGSLIITQLNQEDQGLYRAEIWRTSSQCVQLYDLRVTDEELTDGRDLTFVRLVLSACVFLITCCVTVHHLKSEVFERKR
ncbi:hypothetical protein GDO81_014825 [Engystomops pustulosus]|uniref:Immunoglobulin V-set domain-containing protein n=1 Tax=Engystomops pustulosus TaxID=76066 RepID=A0AAV7AQ17_ENGPU|nr:hypothetical protein GDO81_014825 [Engystomops pustulosus]